VELTVDRGIQNGMDLLVETTADGELVHVITTDEQVVVIYTVNLDTGEQATRTWEAKPA
jgi:indole-3-glycerol phosphate synthase